MKRSVRAPRKKRHGMAVGMAVAAGVAGLLIAGCEHRVTRPNPYDTVLGGPGGALAGNFHAGEGAILLPSAPPNTEAYDSIDDNPFRSAVENPLSTFSIDVDTASYSNVRRFLQSAQRPPRDAVRIEELVNYFRCDYAPPSAADERPFAANFETAAAPWAAGHRLVRIGLKGRVVEPAGRPTASLVFLVDVSGSMHEANKLPLVKRSLNLLVEQLLPDDRVAIVVYAGASGLALPSTLVHDRDAIVAAIEHLEAGGSTNGAAGIQLAYDVATENFIPGGVNRVLLATDGDFNIGVTNAGDLVRLIREKARTGVFLTTLGYGFGNLKDSTLEQLADQGNGAYAYIDSLREAKRVLVEQASSTLITIAKDVKIQVEFNPAQVRAWRLIGYENRLLASEDFNNDNVDAGDIGSGHTVTALYEIVPVGVAWQPDAAVDPLKYQARGESRLDAAITHELLTVKIRYKEPDGDISRLAAYTLTDRGATFRDSSADFKFAAAVAGFGMALRDSPHKGTLRWSDITNWASEGQGQDYGGHRAEFIDLVRRAETLMQ